MQENIGAYCPNCGEPVRLLIDCSVTEQEYIEDCEVCCRPIQITVLVDSEGVPTLNLESESG